MLERGREEAWEMTHTVGRNGERERERKREQDKARKRGLRQGSHEGLGDGVRLYGLNRKGLIYLSSPPESAHVSLPRCPLSPISIVEIFFSLFS